MIKHIKVANGISSEKCLNLLHALSDKTRQEIIMVFARNKELCANDIADKFSLSRPTISHHLNLMRRMGVLNSRKDGKEIYYSLNKSNVVSSLEMMIQTLKKCC